MVDLESDDTQTVFFINHSVIEEFFGENGDAFRAQLFVVDADPDIGRVSPFET